MNFKNTHTLIIFILITGLLVSNSYTVFGSSSDLVKKGKEYVVGNDLEMARNCYDKAIELNPEDVSAYLERSKLWVLLGNCEEAMNDLLEASTINSQAAQDYLDTSDLDESDIKPCFKSFR